MAPSVSEPCTQRQQQPAQELQPAVAMAGAASQERAPAAGTSSQCDQAAAAAAAAAAAVRPERAEKMDRAAVEAEAEALPAGGGEVPRRPAAREESARERLKRHRTEMAGRVRIPEMWGQERLLKDWVDCAVFDRPLAATAGLLNARDALVAECAAARRPAHGSTGRPLRVQNGCS